MALRRKSRWRSRNQRRRRQLCPASKAWAAETRRLNRIEAAAKAEVSLIAEHEAMPPSPPVRRRQRQLRARFTVEILLPNGTRERHQFMTAWSPLFNSWSVPVTRIKDGISALLARAPEIV